MSVKTQSCLAFPLKQTAVNHKTKKASNSFLPKGGSQVGWGDGLRPGELTWLEGQ